MKTILTTFIFLTSLNLLACPDLSGSFFCDMGQGEVTKLVISKRVEGKVTTYTFKENQDEEVLWIVDLKEHSFSSSAMDGISNLKYIASCQTESLILKMSGDIVDFNQKIQVRTVLNIGPGQELIQSTSGQFSDGTPIPQARVSCLNSNAAHGKR